MKLIPEQVSKITRRLEQAKLELQGYEDYFSELSRGSGDNNYTVEDGGNGFTLSQFHQCEQKIKDYEKALQEAERITKIDVHQIDLGTKFILQFDGEEECELFTLVDTTLGMDSQCVTLGSPVGQSLFHLTKGQEFSVDLGNGRKTSGKVKDIITNSKEYIRYITSRNFSNRISRCYYPSEELILTESQRELLLLEKKSLSKKLGEEKMECERFVEGTKVTIQFTESEPRVYTIVDKPEEDINTDREISLNGKLINRFYSRKADGTFTIYERKDGKTLVQKARILDINQKNVYSKRNKQMVIHLLTSRLDTINHLLDTSIKNEVVPDEKKVGIGSHVSIMTFDADGSHNRRVEVIQKAVSYELETDYVEASSPLGVKIMGLTENEEFLCFTQSGKYYTGIVYDIDNRKNAARTTSPLIYQKYYSPRK